MKKTLALILGLALLTTGIVVSSDASRYRPHSDRIAPFRSLKSLRAKYQVSPVRQSTTTFPRMFHRMRQQSQKTFSRSDYQLYRETHPDLFPRHENTVQSERVYVRESRDFRTVPEVRDFEAPLKTLSAPAFSLRATEGFFPVDERTIFHPGLDLTVSAHTFPGRCQGLSFQLCALTNAKHLRRGRDFTDPMEVEHSFLIQKMRTDQKTLLYPAVMESFEVNDFGQEKIVVFVQFLHPMTGEIFYLQGEAPVENARWVKNTMRSLSQTFTFHSPSL